MRQLYDEHYVVMMKDAGKKDGTDEDPAVRRAATKCIGMHFCGHGHSPYSLES